MASGLVPNTVITLIFILGVLFLVFLLILVFDGGKRVFGEWIQEDFREDGEDYVLRWEVYCYEDDFYEHRYPEMKQKYNILKSIQPTDFNQLVRFFSFLTVTED